MIACYETRHFEDNARIWLGKYQHLSNILHWHKECEFIHILHGSAKIQIKNYTYLAQNGSSFFVDTGYPHCISSENNTLIAIIIFDLALKKDVIPFNQLENPMLSSQTRFISVFNKSNMN